jgi:hypothetical protein
MLSDSYCFPLFSTVTYPYFSFSMAFIISYILFMQSSLKWLFYCFPVTSKTDVVYVLRSSAHVSEEWLLLGQSHDTSFRCGLLNTCIHPENFCILTLSSVRLFRSSRVIQALILLFPQCVHTLHVRSPFKTSTATYPPSTHTSFPLSSCLSPSSSNPGYD